MLNRVVISLTVLCLLLSDLTLGRMLRLERDNRAVVLDPRRFGQQNESPTSEIGQACPGQVCGPLSALAINALLAKADPCAQQDVGDAIINASRQFDAKTQANMVNLAIQLVTAERNTAENFSTQPPTERNSLFCQKAPQNSQLNCLVQKQFSGNDPNVFVDPVTGDNILKGTDPRTKPFCENHNINANSVNKSSSPSPGKTTTTQTKLSSTSKNSKGCRSQLSSSGNNTLATKGQNLQLFKGTLGAPAPTVTKTANNQFQVEGNALFKTLQNACQRACDIQHNKCADAANKGHNSGNLTVAACGTQQAECSKVAQASGTGTGTQPSLQGDSASGSVKKNSTTSKQGDRTSDSKLGNSTLTTSNGGQGNLLKFNGKLGGIPPPSLTKDADGKFRVNGSTFLNFNTAVNRACDEQHNQCADAANAQHNDGGFTVGDCDKQDTQCKQQGQSTATGTGNQPSSKGNTSLSKQENSTLTTSNGGQGNLLKFNGKLGGIPPPSLTKDADGKFDVSGNKFLNFNTAVNRACDEQHNQCADAANAQHNDGGFTVGDCDKQDTQCKQQGQSTGTT